MSRIRGSCASDERGGRRFSIHVCRFVLIFLLAVGRGFGQADVPAADDGRLDAAERQRVVDAVAENLREHYFDRDVAQKIADALLAREISGEYGAVTDGGAFADLLTRQMRDVSH